MMNLNLNEKNMEGTGFLWLKGNSKVVICGFDDYVGKYVRVSELDGKIILAQDDEEIPIEECILFIEENLSCPTAIKYFRKHGVFQCLFVQIFGVYAQCKGIKIDEILS